MSDVDLNSECEICGEQNSKTFEEHHIVPRRYGGSDKPENIVNLCANCHAAVERIWDDDFYRRLEQAKDGLEVNSGEDNELGHVIEEGTPDRRIPIDSPHVRVETAPADDEVIQRIVDMDLRDDATVALYCCGYCDRVFKPFNQADLATHLQRSHSISDPYMSCGSTLGEALIQPIYQPNDDENDEKDMVDPDVLEQFNLDREEIRNSTGINYIGESHEYRNS